MSNELMSAIVYTPTTEVVRQIATFPRLRLGEPRHLTEGAFERWFAEEIRKAQHKAFAEGVLQADIDIILERDTYTNPYEKED